MRSPGLWAFGLYMLLVTVVIVLLLPAELKRWSSHGVPIANIDMPPGYKITEQDIRVPDLVDHYVISADGIYKGQPVRVTDVWPPVDKPGSTLEVVMNADVSLQQQLKPWQSVWVCHADKDLVVVGLYARSDCPAGGGRCKLTVLLSDADAKRVADTPASALADKLSVVLSTRDCKKN